MRPRWPRRVSAHVLSVQLVITTGVTALATGLFLEPLGAQLDDQAEHRALAIAQATAAQPGIAHAVLAGPPDPEGPVQAAAERIRLATDASYVVVVDTRGIRYSHTTPAEIGRHVSTDPGQALGGREWTGIESGTLGRSARGKVPLRDGEGAIVGAVSVGIAYGDVRDLLLHALPGILVGAGAALAAGALAAFALSWRLRKRTHGIELSEISALLDEREAMLHGIREGVVALDRRGRVRLVNDAARRLLGLGPDVVGQPLEAVLPPGRTTEVLTGRVAGQDLLIVSGGRVLVANRMDTADGGTVATLRDRTELEQLGRELDGTRGLTEALRAQDHEHANRLHTLLGLLELGMYEEAVDFVAEVTGAHRATAEQVTERVQEPLVSALLVGKSAVAAERGVALRVSAGTRLPERVVDPRDLVTVLGNLVDNALDAAGPCPGPFVEVELRAVGATVVLTVADNGPGVPEEVRELVFADGWSTKEPAPHRPRGLGLSLVRRLAERYGGSARVGERPGGGAVFTVELPEALRTEELGGRGPDGEALLREARDPEGSRPGAPGPEEPSRAPRPLEGVNQ
ncbi:histidine kinase [Streptomyces cinnamoneus]|uniref:histidine kinase n=1 Tax=Streptomyces cinnamoneus TaxID=53446 RepID=A0A2G1X9E8_STRCJ|nr:sensor histidine kinase [Streptomyces cinnamoneus]PHQ47850.1 histidine kinase [Streptomyces cinnamoneus]PPT15475.1 sensor histidine kinase [Streptomyces cinnamoneus]